MDLLHKLYSAGWRAASHNSISVSRDNSLSAVVVVSKLENVIVVSNLNIIRIFRLVFISSEVFNSIHWRNKFTIEGCSFDHVPVLACAVYTRTQAVLDSDVSYDMASTSWSNWTISHSLIQNTSILKSIQFRSWNADTQVLFKAADSSYLDDLWAWA
jgi:hypothetical protein